MRYFRLEYFSFNERNIKYALFLRNESLHVFDINLGLPYIFTIPIV